MPGLGDIRAFRQMKQSHPEFYLCRACLADLFKTERDLERFLGNHFRDWTRGIDILESLASRLPAFGRHHVEETHQTIVCPFRKTQGPITDSTIATLLRKINPDLLKLNKHFDERASLHPEIPLELERIGRRDLNSDKKKVSTYKLLQGKRGKQKESEESLASLHLRVAVRRYEPDIQDRKQTIVRIESGLQVFLSLIKAKAQSVLNGFHVHGRAEASVEALATRQLEWYLFERYLVFTGEEARLDRINARWPDELPCLDDAFWELDLLPHTIRTMKGDLAILMYWVDKRSNLRQGRITRQDLFTDLRILAYPRLRASDDQDQRQALNRILKEMASAGEMVTVFEMNWASVLDLIEQERSRRSQT